MHFPQPKLRGKKKNSIVSLFLQVIHSFATLDFKHTVFQRVQPTFAVFSLSDCKDNSFCADACNIRRFFTAKQSLLLPNTKKCVFLEKTDKYGLAIKLLQWNLSKFASYF